MVERAQDASGIEARMLLNIAQNAVAAALANGGGGPHDPGMEARVAKLESSVQGIESALREMVPNIKEMGTLTKQIAEGMPKIREDLAELKGRMTGVEGQLRQVPSLWSMGGTMLAINAGIVAVAGLIIVLIKSM